MTEGRGGDGTPAIWKSLDPETADQKPRDGPFCHPLIILEFKIVHTQYVE